MRDWLKWAHDQSNECSQVFNRVGEPIKEFRSALKNPAPLLPFLISSSTISGVPPSATCAPLGFPKLSVCASLDIGQIRWSGVTIL